MTHNHQYNGRILQLVCLTVRMARLRTAGALEIKPLVHTEMLTCCKCD